MADTTAVKVRLHGVEYLLIGDLEEGGGITTADDFRAGRVSFAHLFPDGRIQRFGEVIAERDELEIAGEVQVEFDGAEVLAGCLTDPSWTQGDDEDA